MALHAVLLGLLLTDTTRLFVSITIVRRASKPWWEAARIFVVRPPGMILIAVPESLRSARSRRMLLNPQTWPPLTKQTISQYLRLGGTFIHSSRNPRNPRPA